HPALDRERLPWAGRLARLGGRWRVVIHGDGPGSDYRDLLNRSRVLFTYDLRGACGPEVVEAIAAGAVAFVAAGSQEARDHQECVYYTADDLEALLEHYLGHEGERCALAEAARDCLARHALEAQARQILAILEREWDRLAGRAGQRPAFNPRSEL